MRPRTRQNHKICNFNQDMVATMTNHGPKSCFLETIELHYQIVISIHEPSNFQLKILWFQDFQQHSYHHCGTSKTQEVRGREEGTFFCTFNQLLKTAARSRLCFKVMVWNISVQDKLVLWACILTWTLRVIVPQQCLIMCDPQVRLKQGNFIMHKLTCVQESIRSAI